MNKLVCIDAGHGGNDCGAVNVIKGGPSEARYNMMIADLLVKELKERGFDTMLTRKDDTFISLSERVSKANNMKADLFVSLHHNSFSGTSATARGTEVCIYSLKNEANKNLAAKMSKAISFLFDVRDRGVKERPGLYVLKRTKMPAILIEFLFMSSKDDMEIAAKDGYAEAAADRVADIVADYLRKK